MTETSSHEPAALALENVGKRFGSVIALSDVSMSVPKNRVTCVLGDNGAGKSTLIKILSGVHTPSDGQMYVNGEPTTFSSPRRSPGYGNRHCVSGSRDRAPDGGVAEFLPR